MCGCLIADCCATCAQEGNVSLAAIGSDPFIDCYRAWLKERAYSSGTAADFLQSFARTSGDAPRRACSMLGSLLRVAASMASWPVYFRAAGSPVDQWMQTWIYRCAVLSPCPDEGAALPSLGCVTLAR